MARDGGHWSTRRRWVVGLSAALVVAVCVWLVWAWFVIFHPSTDQPARADAIVVLGPYLDDRFAEAVDVAHRYGIDQIAVSVGDTPAQLTTGFCDGLDAQAGPSIAVTCFVPDPYTTRGEAQAIGALAGERQWTTVLVIAYPPQLSRARLLIERCFSGSVLVVPTPGGASFNLGDLLHQTGAYVKAAFASSC